MFQYTHRPIQVYSGVSEVTEGEVLSEFLRSDQSRKTVIVIEGNTGTGKSELCVFLALALKEKGRIVLQIEKNADLVDIMTEVIPNFYKIQTGKEFPEFDQLRKWRTLMLENPGLVATSSSSDVLLRLREMSILAVPVTDRDAVQEALKKIILQRLKLVSEKGEDPADIEFISAQDLSLLFKNRPIISRRNLSQTDEAKELNKLVWESIRQRGSIPSLDRMIQEVARGLAGRRPVIIFEDFSITGLDFVQLSRYMESDTPGDVCDFIVAGTQDKVRSLHTSTAEARFKFYSTTQEGSTVLFLDGDSAYEFIEPFLSYIKTLDGSLKNSGTEIAKGTVCESCPNKCPQADIRSFPFNRPFVRELYSSLPEAEKKPRTFVDRVYKIIREYKDNAVPPSEAVTLNGLPISRIVDESVVSDEKLVRLMQWYGNDESGSLNLNSRYAELFGINSNDFLRNGVIIVPELGSNGQQSAPTQSVDQSTERLRAVFERLKGFVVPWSEDPNHDNVKDFATYFTLGLKKLLEISTQGYRLSDQSLIQLKIGENEGVFSYNGAGPIERVSVDVLTRDFNQSQILNVLSYGISLQEGGQFGPDETQLIEELSYPLGKMIIQFRGLFYRLLRIPSQLGKTTNFQLEDFAVAYFTVLSILEDPFRNLDGNSLSEKFSEVKSFQINSEALSDIFSQEQETILQQTMAAGAVQMAKEVLKEFYGISGNAFDSARINIVCIENPFGVLRTLTRRDLPLAGKVLLNREPLADLIDLFWSIRSLSSAGSDYLKHDLDQRVEFARVVEEEIADLDLENMKATVNELRPHLRTETELLANIDQLASQSQSTISELQEKCMVIISLVKEFIKTHNESTALRLAVGVKLLRGDPNIILNLRLNKMLQETETPEVKDAIRKFLAFLEKG